jgi:uncharacterized membrane protein YeaQ/YmgE (transglycosylase-associated protein family)
MEGRGVLAIVLIGLVAGWLASFVVGGGGLISYIIWGVLGSFVGGFLLPRMGLRISTGNVLINQVATAAIGAIALVLVTRLIF